MNSPGLRIVRGRIKNWQKSYPPEIFREPDWGRVQDALRAHQISLDAVSAAIIRSTLEDVIRLLDKEIADGF